MADYTDLDPTLLRASVSDGTNLKPSITTSSYSGGTPSAAADLKRSIAYADGTLKPSIADSVGVKASWLLAGSARPPGGGLWTPAEITTKTWLDASTDDADYITETSNEVSQWDDRSGEDSHQAQASASLQPSIGDYTIGGKRTVYYDGTERTQAASNPLASTFTSAAIFAVIKTQGTGTNGALFDLTANTAGNAYYTHCPWSDGNIYFDVGGSGGANRVSGASGFSNGDDNIVGFITDTSLQEIRINGDVLASDATGHAVTHAGGIRLGSNVSYSQNVAIGEFIVVEGSITTDTRQRIEGYLAHKWSLTAGLDAGHPYKSSAPTV